MTSHYDEPAETDIAIIGLSGRFPGADSPDELWKKVAAGEELISFFSDDELLNSGVDERVLREPGYVNAAPVLNDPSRFDALFFGYPRAKRQPWIPNSAFFSNARQPHWNAPDMIRTGMTARLVCSPVRR